MRAMDSNRIPRFVEYVQKGWINLEGKPQLVGAKGAVENYDGQLGIGITNALFCAERAAELAKEHGIGCVALKNTTHWMRGGTYAWKMAEAGFMGMSWINTESCMPLWGSDEPSVGNNPFCMAIPREDGPIVLDMAMSQYAYGKLGVYRLAGKQLPYPGGFDKEGNLTSDPELLRTAREFFLPDTGREAVWLLHWIWQQLLWQTADAEQIWTMRTREAALAAARSLWHMIHIFFGTKEEIQSMLNKRVAAANAAHPEREGGHVTCPGQRTIATREKSMKDGVSVDEAIWEQICALAAGNMETKDIASK